VGEFGNFILCLSWLLACFSVLGGSYGASRNDFAWFRSARNSTICSTFTLLVSLGALSYQFLTDDYTNQFVWQFSNRSMPWIYKFTAVWGGMDGSMLLWAFILSVSCGLLAWGALKQPWRLMQWVLVAANTSLLFFVTVVCFFTNPFRYINAPFIPPDGNGLNPLLQNPYMAIHPPMLYLGFTTFAIPYAFCMGALLAGDLSSTWIRLTRRWTLIAWGFLTLGIVLGGHWAYLELGWGGFWAWDPVENASFLPWLTGTAFLHSVMVQERKEMLKVWNIWLVVLTYGLTVFGTFLTRSGIVQSVHAFASTDIGWIFLSYLAFLVLWTTWLVRKRRTELVSQRHIESILSREAAFLLNNLLFLSICFAIFWGVMFPVFSEAVTGKKQTIGIPFFNAVTLPLFLAMLFLMGVGPLIAWRKASLKSVRRTFLAPFLSGMTVSAIFVWAGVTSFYAILSYGICFFVLMTIIGEFHRGLKVQRATTSQQSFLRDTSSLFRRHRTRYGGYLVHFGVLVMTIAITASMAHKTEQEFTLAPGETKSVGRFTFTLAKLGTQQTSNYEALQAEIILGSIGSTQAITTLLPELRHYVKNQESTSEVALKSSPREDVYVVLAGLDNTGTKAALKVFINPLQVWLWIGTWVVLIGTIIVLIPAQRSSFAVQTAPHQVSLKV
jgi:cytochrome c-type biogenesis protein CcmF